MIEQGREEEIIMNKIDSIRMKDLLEIITIIAEKMKGIIQYRFGRCIMSNNLIEKIKISEDNKEIEIFHVLIWSI